MRFNSEAYLKACPKPAEKEPAPETAAEGFNPSADEGGAEDGDQ